MIIYVCSVCICSVYVHIYMHTLMVLCALCRDFEEFRDVCHRCTWRIMKLMLTYEA